MIASPHGPMPAALLGPSGARGDGAHPLVTWAAWPSWPRPARLARLAGQDRSMSALKDQLRSDLTAAMKARDEIRTRTLRMALTSVTQEEVAGTSARELSDD